LAPYETLIEQLYVEEFSLATALDTSDIVLHVEGPAVENREPRLSILTSFFSGVKSEIRHVATALLGVEGKTGLPRDMDLSLTALAPGSLFIGLRIADPDDVEHTGQMITADPYLEATRNAVHAMGLVSRYLGKGLDDPEGLKSDIPDAKVRDVALAAFQRLAPSDKRGISAVGISVKSEAGEPISSVRLTSETRASLRKKFHEAIKSPVSITVEGLIREIDLDLQRCEIRHVEALNFFEVRCHYPKEMESEIKKLLDKRVVAQGPAEIDRSGRPNLMTISVVKQLDT
jgi:hypothetical protein